MSDFLRVLKSSYGASGLELDSDALAKINRYTLRSHTPEELFAFKVTACDNEVDRDCEAFTVGALERLANMLPGKSIIADHECKAEGQQARIYEATVVSDGQHKTARGEPYARLEIHCYMPRSAYTAEQICLIEAGIRKEVSISCRIEKQLCSICGKDYWSTDCPHTKGDRYEGASCFVRLDAPSDAYEVSFVAVPAQKNAGVTKSAEPDAWERFGAELHGIACMLKQLHVRMDTLTPNFTGSPPPLPATTPPDGVLTLVNEAKKLVKYTKGV